MTLAQRLLPEFDHEMKATRALLERVPESDAAWQPHPRSMTLGGLAVHVATLPFWAITTLATGELDVHPSGEPPMRAPEFRSTAALPAQFDRQVDDARAALAAASDADLAASWTLKQGGVGMFTMRRAAGLRSSVMNHLIHHRGQRSVYLRLRDVPLPSIHGPTADTPM